MSDVVFHSVILLSNLGGDGLMGIMTRWNPIDNCRWKKCMYRVKLTLSANILKKDFPTFFKDILKFINSQLKHTRFDSRASTQNTF